MFFVRVCVCACWRACVPVCVSSPSSFTPLQLSKIFVDDSNNRVAVEFVPTIPHCSASTLIGLSIRIKLQVCGLGFGVWGLGLGFWGLGFGV